MKITILSGGSGNDALVRGIKSIYPDAEITILLNAYDSGKSTGICRYVTNTLGVSDIRKNHIRLYEKMSEIVDKNIVEFYNNRYNFTKGKEKEEVIALLNKWNLQDLVPYAEDFFSIPLSEKYDYNDFNVANIVYSSMYRQRGYITTNFYFEGRLGLEDRIILNSFDNVALKAVAKSGYIIHDEGELVEYCNEDDPIVSLYFEDFIHNLPARYPEGLTTEAVKAVTETDLIVISSGTFWSSIFPTIVYNDFYKYINESKAKKIWVMNNEQDKDSYGVSARDFAETMEEFVNLKDFTILINSDANMLLKKLNRSDLNVHSASMGNFNGKHDGDKLAKEVLKTYFGINDTYDYYLFDFDDTIYSRLADKDIKLKKLSIENCIMVSELGDKAKIISGNSYSSIRAKLSSIYGSSMNVGVDIWADANSILYKNNEMIDYNIDCVFAKFDIEKIRSILDVLKIENDKIFERGFNDVVTCMSIKPLEEKYRTLLVEYLNILFSVSKIPYKATATGFSTVDIVKVNNTKASLFIKLPDLYKFKTFYVGDEIDSGNDKDIAMMCTAKLRVDNIKETNAFLKLLKDSINK